MSARIPRLVGAVLITAPIGAKPHERFLVSQLRGGRLILHRTQHECDLDEIARLWNNDSYEVHRPESTRQLRFVDLTRPLKFTNLTQLMEQGSPNVT